MAFPKMLRLKQKFQKSSPVNVPIALAEQFASLGLLAGIKPGARIAVTAGSRGITAIAGIVGSVIKLLKDAGADPFIVPAMGSHGGATPEGQLRLLADYNITEATMGVPIRASMETKILGTTADGVPVHFSVEALNSDGIVVLNRIKPHTDFQGGAIASGMMKMIAIGLAKRNGAEACHAAAARLGHERVVTSAARISLTQAPILCAIGIVEDPFHQTAIIKVTRSETIEIEEAKLLNEARARMPKLPFDDVDLLIVDRIGKNISGTGMDTNIVGRGVQGYSSSLIPGEIESPIIRRLFVRGLTPQSHGNAVGIGIADFVTTRLVNSIDRNATYINSLTAMTPQLSKIPIYFDTDRDVIQKAIGTLALAKDAPVRCIRIADTLSLEEVWVSDAYAAEISARGDLEIVSEAMEMVFNADGNLD
ncbi:MAG: lactate racemase domain-containing protein [Planctomycetota bacterium]